MLLRLEVDGFKNLVGFVAEFGPLTCIAGENGVGKSNVFDAIEFLSLIADQPLIEAARLVRSNHQDNAGEPIDLFTIGPTDRRMRFAVEMIVPPRVIDDFGVEAATSITLLRYEVQIGYESPTPPSRQGRLVVESEQLTHINRGDAHRHIRFPHSARAFRDAVVVGRRSGGPFISTEPANNRITVHQDGGSRGRPRRALPTRATTTVVSTVNTADDPTVLAVRREMQSWRRLALEPSALRTADRFTDPRVMSSNGRHLAAALYRIAHSPNQGVTSSDVYARVATRLSTLAGLDARDVRVDVDDVRELLNLVVIDGHRGELSARSLSEGTLRYLALCVLLEDPSTTGLLAMEEPENGIHPANLAAMVRLAEDLAVDASYPPDDDNPMRQVLLNTHSPGVVQLVAPADLLLATERFVEVDGGHVRALRLDGIDGTWRSTAQKGATKADLLPYLQHPPGAQTTLFDVA